MAEDGVDIVVLGKYIYASAVGEAIFAKTPTMKSAVSALRPGNGSQEWVKRTDGAAHGIEAFGRIIFLQLKGSVEVYRYWDY